MSLAAAAEKAVRGPTPGVDGRADVLGFVLTVMSGACAVGATSEELAVAMFRARAAAWFRAVGAAERAKQ